MQPSELQSALRAHPGVREAAIVSQEGASGEKKLIVYVVADSGYWEQALSSTKEERKRLEKWRKTFDLMQSGKAAASSVAFDVAGWNSTYTRQPIPAEEMREWVETTVTEILALRPQQVLEIGCGTGLVLLRVAPHCRRYVGTDQSAAAMQRLKDQLAQSTASLPSATALLERSADNFEGFSANSFDTVILNSVVQYFPSVTYLVRALEQVVELTKPGGKIFLGDVRSLLLFELYAASVELYQAPPTVDVEALRERVFRRMRQQEELLLSPSFFLALQRRFPRISRVEIKPRRGRFDNEMTRFRFNAILTVGTPAEPTVEPDWLEWSALQLTLDSVKQALAKPECQILAIKSIPNARLQGDLAAMNEIRASYPSRTVASLKESVATRAVQGVHPHALFTLADELGFSLDLSWAGAQPGGRFDALFERIPREQTARETVVAWPKPVTVSDNFADHANTPGQTNLAGKLIQELSQFIKENLAAETSPVEIVLVEAIPSALADEPNLDSLKLTS